MGGYFFYNYKIDVTRVNTLGLGIELGWVNMVGCPILCIYKKGAKPSASLDIILKNFIEYVDSIDMVDRLSQWVGKHKVALLKDGLL